MQTIRTILPLSGKKKKPELLPGRKDVTFTGESRG